MGREPLPEGVAAAMPELTTEKRLLAQIAAHESWARTLDRTARTRNARKGLDERFLREAGGDPKRAESLRKAFYARLALKSAQARRRRSGDRRAAIEPRLDGGGDDAA